MEEIERKAREEIFCCGCGRPKNIGLVVCWPCFKSRRDITPLKYFEGLFSEWVVLSLGARQ